MKSDNFENNTNNLNIYSIEELENLRLKIHSQIKLLIIIETIIFILITFIILLKIVDYENIEGLAWIFILVFVFFYYFISKSKTKFKEGYKNSIVFDIFKRNFENVEYNPDIGISEYKIKNTKIMYMGSAYTASDYIKGNYKNVPFEFSDINIWKANRSSDYDSADYLLFEGQWFIFDFNKIFQSNVYVCQKKFNNINNYHKEFHKVKLEDIEFNEQFDVYAENDVDAFYILTPIMIESLKNIIRENNGKYLFCFVDNKLHIGLESNKNLYEWSIFKKIDVEKCEEVVLKEMNLITQVVDVLNLDNDLFRKGE